MPSLCMFIIQDAAISGGNASFYPAPFSIDYRTVKRVTSNPISVTLYAPASGSSGAVTGQTWAAGVLVNSGDLSVATYYTSVNIGTKTCAFKPNTGAYTGLLTAAGASNPIGTIVYNYAIDARLGVV